MIKNEDLSDEFAEGVWKTTEEGWVHPGDIEDPVIRAQYQAVVTAFEEYDRLARAFQATIDNL